MKSRAGFGLVPLVMLLASSAVGCPCTDRMLNQNRELRWYVFAEYGANRVCEEMTKRGALVRVPVPVPGFGTATGRFYPQTCQSSINEATRTLSVWLTGTGYAWTPVTLGMSFECALAVDYQPDFHKDGDEVYVWFNTVGTRPPQFRVTHIEQPVSNLALRLYPVEWFAGALTRSFVSVQLAQGFTVIQEDDELDFSLGHLPLGQRPVHPWSVRGSQRYTYANETTEVHGGEQDFLGPYEVSAERGVLFLKMQVSGPPVDVFVVSKNTGDLWRFRYQGLSPPAPPPPGGAVFQQAQTPASGLFDGWVAVPRGSYYIVIDNSAYAGVLSPAAKLPTPFDPSLQQGARINYLVQLGDRP